ncbi:hypothetical protein Tco_1506459 [Tanacetum coccineum]
MLFIPNIFDQEVESFSRKSFCEDVCKLIFGYYDNRDLSRVIHFGCANQFQIEASFELILFGIVAHVIACVDIVWKLLVHQMHGLYVTIRAGRLLWEYPWPGLRGNHKDLGNHLEDVEVRKSGYSLIPLSHGSSDVIMGMDWLSKRKFVIVCHEKVVRLPLEGDEILRTLEDIMRACVIDFGGSYHLSIRCAPFEALYGRKCRSPVLWAEIGESSLTGLELVQETTDKVVLVKEKPKAARDRQKSYVDYRRKPLEFEVGDRVLLKVTPWKGVVRFGKKGKLAPRYVGPFEILERIGPFNLKN